MKSMLANYLGTPLTSWLAIALYILAGFFALFLFFRAGRHELVDDEVLFDTTLIGAIGALFVGRVIDFFTRSDFYKFSIKKLVFFNAFSGFDWYGALLGTAILAGVYLKRKKQKVLFIFDLASAPIVFGAMLASLVNYLLFGKLIATLYFAGLLVIFWILKRFAKTKKFDGFFATLSLILTGFLNLALYPHLFLQFDYQRVATIITPVLGLLLFYKFSKRTPRADLKNLSAAILLSLFKTKRVLFSTSEANLVARSILLSPYYLVKLLLHLVKLLGREIYISMIDLKNIVRLKK